MAGIAQRPARALALPPTPGMAGGATPAAAMGAMPGQIAQRAQQVSLAASELRMREDRAIKDDKRKDKAQGAAEAANRQLMQMKREELGRSQDVHEYNMRSRRKAEISNRLEAILMMQTSTKQRESSAIMAAMEKHSTRIGKKLLMDRSLIMGAETLAESFDFSDRALKWDDAMKEEINSGIKALKEQHITEFGTESQAASMDHGIFPGLHGSAWEIVKGALGGEGEGAAQVRKLSAAADVLGFKPAAKGEPKTDAFKKAWAAKWEEKKTAYTAGLKGKNPGKYIEAREGLDKRVKFGREKMDLSYNAAVATAIAEYLSTDGDKARVLSLFQKGPDVADVLWQVGDAKWWGLRQVLTKALVASKDDETKKIIRSKIQVLTNYKDPRRGGLRPIPYIMRVRDKIDAATIATGIRTNLRKLVRGLKPKRGDLVEMLTYQIMAAPEGRRRDQMIRKLYGIVKEVAPDLTTYIRKIEDEFEKVRIPAYSVIQPGVK